MIIEQNFFWEQGRKGRRPLVRACDEMLAPGGYLVFKEYRYDQFKRIPRIIKSVLGNYQQIGIPPLKQDGFWLIYQKPNEK